MITQPLFSVRNPWFTVSLGLTAALAAATTVAGLVLFPLAQTTFPATGIWDAICSAAGVPRQSSAVAVEPPTFKTSQALVGSNTIELAAPNAVGRGATLAQQCAICHGAGGVRKADFPTLAGQPAAVISKELQDFRSGARSSSIMGPFATALSDQDVDDLAAYFAYIPRVPGDIALSLPIHVSSPTGRRCETSRLAALVTEVSIPRRERPGSRGNRLHT